jgi:excisionase family DNA binding protein
MDSIVAGGPVLLTLKDAAERLAVSRRTLERLIASKQFRRPFKIGRSSRVSLQDISEYLDGRNKVRRG